MAKYTYKLENGEYVFYKDEKPLKTPHKAPITTDKEGLAKLLLTSLEHKAGYKSPTSLLTYHYTYCNLKAQFTQDFIADDFSNCVKAEMLMEDDYLMFRESTPLKIAIANSFEKYLTENFHHYNLYQLAAVLVINTLFYRDENLARRIMREAMRYKCDDDAPSSAIPSSSSWTKPLPMPTKFVRTTA